LLHERATLLLDDTYRAAGVRPLRCEAPGESLRRRSIRCSKSGEGTKNMRIMSARSGTRIAVLFAALLTFTVLGTGVASAAKGGTSRPYSARGTLTGSFDFVSGAFEAQGSAIESHLGKSSVEVVSPDGLNFVVTTTAANGDTLTSALASELAPPAIDCPANGFVFNDPYENLSTFTAGTGRFADVSGTVDTKGCFGADASGNLVITFTATGTLSY
jgi:hypothetical protein